MKDFIAVNKTRIQQRLQTLAVFGKNANGGIDRSFGSTADLAAREHLITLMKTEIGATVRTDAAANIWANINNNSLLPVIVVGSHHDTVSNGGMYDGALGIILAIEVLQTIKESNYPLRHPIAMVSFTAEEPNPFNLSTFGSRSATGKLCSDKILEVEDRDTHTSLASALEKAGGSIMDLASARIQPGQLSAFIECHIEQGKRLDTREIPLAVVSSITGIYRESIRIYGEANHAGTTMMHDRHDALLAASELCLAFEKVLREAGRDDVVGTIGHMEIYPNSVNIIPGEAVLILELRTPDPIAQNEVLKGLAKHIAKIAADRNACMQRSILLDQASVELDEIVMTAMKRVIDSMSEQIVILSSMAGHDAAHLAGVTKSGMLFVRSIDGKSHCPQEYSSIEDIEKAGNILLKTVLLLDGELDIQ